jgi:hypothetical protein
MLAGQAGDDASGMGGAGKGHGVATADGFFNQFVINPGNVQTIQPGCLNQFQQQLRALRHRWAGLTRQVLPAISAGTAKRSNCQIG